MAPSSRRDPFGPDWLRERLTHLLPGFPDISICVALSGGIDSTALLGALAEERPDGGRGGTREVRLRAIHVNHGLHPNAKRWSAHCRKLARQLGVPLRVVAVRVARERGASLEEAARLARYQCFTEQLREGESLLTCSRAELEAWVRSRGLAWIEDDTNLDERFDRNYLRQRVLPAVRERWPGVAAAVSRSARHAAEAQGLLTALAQADLERASDGAALSVKVLKSLPPDRRRNVLRLWIVSSGRALPDARRLAEIAGPLIEARPDAHPQVHWGAEGGAGRGTVVMRHAALLSIADRGPVLNPSTPDTRVAWDWRESPRCALPGGGALELIPARHGPIDLDALPAQLSIAWRRGGERLRVRHGGPHRALKSLLQEAHVPLAERARLPLVLARGALIAAADLWIDASIRAPPRARHRGRLLWRKPTGSPP